MSENALVGIYMRLSRDDEKAGESLSIENQRTILRRYALERNFTVVEEYIDDGFSGTSFDRPAFKRMLYDAKCKKIDTILAKDLSRLGRNYIEVGRLVDYIFPAEGIRFIALSDNIDTQDRSSSAMDMMPIMNIFNEWHAASTSKKIRAVFDANRRAGKCMSWSYPYGYRAGGDEMRRAVVDEEAARIVRRIFSLRLKGNSAKAIAKILSDEKIPNPSAHFTRLSGEKSSRANSFLWTPQTVRWILSNEVYLGNLVQHKTERISYKIKKMKSVPKEEWTIKEHAHEPIISREIFNRVQESFCLSRGRADKKGKVHSLSGLLTCSSCGKKMKFKGAKDGQGCFVCRTYIDLGKNYCTAHRIKERDLEEILKSEFSSLFDERAFDEAKERENFFKGSDERQGEFLSYHERLKEIEKRLKEIEKLSVSAFEEQVLGDLPRELSCSLLKKYSLERDELFKEQQKIEEWVKNFKSRDEELCKIYIKTLKKFLQEGYLSREICLRLIARIEVGESGEGGQEIKIIYKVP